MHTSNPKFKLIIGLGNPDPKYANTYHNVGHLFLDFLIENRENFQFPISNDHLLKTDVYMNESGAFVKKALKKYNAQPEELLIVHDDSDIAVGNYKLSFERGAAGHHGIESIQQHLNTNNFWRLRIGIRPQNEKIRQKAEKFVLKKISATNKKILEKVFQKAIEVIA
jgi:PTH1 family peptidyl-tRNA hydrolase